MCLWKSAWGKTDTGKFIVGIEEEERGTEGSAHLTEGSNLGKGNGTDSKSMAISEGKNRENDRVNNVSFHYNNFVRVLHAAQNYNIPFRR